eukprot:CAMPEP_0194111706 /NCGR_PEP_ID=MMETSP0150-20130528/10649_1 /TAXON_ID=122233 /ORGANISM="Chaetoceros debilis, Strain MM31A-1" /LENGTH=223 /DNA_ID=CAMNT_0038801205 /DNA_START=20 /DNA_END=688 /DNA_ORIENTATION=+
MPEQGYFNKEKIITIVSSDGKLYHLTESETLSSRLIQDAIENEDSDSDEAAVEDGLCQNLSSATNIGDCTEDTTAAAGIPTPTTVPLVNVRSDCLDHIVRFMKHHSGDPLNPIIFFCGSKNASSSTDSIQSQMVHRSNECESEFNDIVVQEWYRSFIQELPKEMVFKMVNAANYMDIPSLLDLSVLRVSADMMDKDAEGIRKMLNLPKMSEEDERKAREEHRW